VELVPRREAVANVDLQSGQRIARLRLQHGREWQTTLTTLARRPDAKVEQRLREREERIGKATIYRTLEMLVKSGLVQEHDFGEGFKRYEHLFGQKPVREHLICTECG
jgi:Fe2+ or Zn2+ uptake regulation protein